MMKKLLTLFLSFALCFSMAACGGDTDTSDGSPTDAQLEALTEAYNEVAVLYNDVATNANANGWSADSATIADITAIGDVLDPIGTALNGDMSALDGADFDALPDVLLEFLPDLERLAETVSVPYAGDAMVVTDEKLIPVANAVNEVVPLYNEVYATAEENGWLADEQTAEELQAVAGTLTYTQSGLTDDPSKLENVEDFDELATSILEFVPALEEMSARVSVPYEG